MFLAISVFPALAQKAGGHGQGQNSNNQGGGIMAAAPLLGVGIPARWHSAACCLAQSF